MQKEIFVDESQSEQMAEEYKAELITAEHLDALVNTVSVFGKERGRHDLGMGEWVN